MPPLVIYHANCTDGFLAAYSAWKYLGDTAEYFAAKHGKVNSIDDLPLLEGRVVYILDFGIDDKEVMQAIFERASHVTWLDHHATSFSVWCGPKYLDEKTLFTQNVIKTTTGRRACCIILDNQRSGALLAWNHFNFNAGPSTLINYVDDYDRGIFALPNTSNLILSLVSRRPWTFESLDELNIALGAPSTESEYFNQMLTEGNALARMNSVMVAEPVTEAVSCFLPTLVADEEVQGLAASCTPLMANDVGRVLAESSGTYGLCWHMQRDGQLYCSLRSNGDFDVRPLAELHGGGGHRNSAAFRISINVLRQFLKLA